MPIPPKVKGICAFKYKLKKFPFTTLYIPSFSYDETKVYIYIKCKLHLAKGLKANILIGNKIFDIENFSINLSSASTHIQSCSIDIIINAKYYA